MSEFVKKTRRKRREEPEPLVGGRTQQMEAREGRSQFTVRKAPVDLQAVFAGIERVLRGSTPLSPDPILRETRIVPDC